MKYCASPENVLGFGDNLLNADSGSGDGMSHMAYDKKYLK